MKRHPPSLLTTVAVIITLITVPLITATVTAVLVKEWISTGLILLFSVTVLVVIIPYIALVSNLVSSNSWLRAYIQVLSKLPVIKLVVPSLDGLFIDNKVFRFKNIVEKRINARDWKLLHLKAQEISLKLIVIRGSMSSDFQLLLHDLEVLWQQDCSGKIVQFVRLDGLANGTVKSIL